MSYLAPFCDRGHALVDLRARAANPASKLRVDVVKAAEKQGLPEGEVQQLRDAYAATGSPSSPLVPVKADYVEGSTPHDGVALNEVPTDQSSVEVHFSAKGATNHDENRSFTKIDGQWYLSSFCNRKP